MNLEENRGASFEGKRKATPSSWITQHNALNPIPTEKMEKRE